MTLDWSFSNGRDWGSPWIPEKMDLKSCCSFAPEVISRPGWLLSFLRHGQLPDLSTPNMAPVGQKPPTFFGAYGEWMQSELPTWDDLAWLRSQWTGRSWSRGSATLMTPTRVVDCGATALSVSNHGGNNLDGTPAPIRPCRPWSTRSATRSRSSSTVASGEAATSSRPSPSGRRPS